jgi:hypothetical protein
MVTLKETGTFAKPRFVTFTSGIIETEFKPGVKLVSFLMLLIDVTATSFINLSPMLILSI